MSSRFVLRSALVLAMLGLWMTGILAQSDRELVAGVSVDNAFDGDTVAQVYTYTADADESIKLTLISADAVALGVIVADGEGATVAQGRDNSGSGILVLDNIELDEAGSYLITVFPVATADAPLEGEYSISLARSSAAAAGDGDTNEEAEATPTEDAEEPTETSEPTPTVEVDTAPADGSIDTVVDAVAPSQVLTTSGIEVSLTWNATADFNLEVRDPVGGSAFWDSPNTESGGSFQGFNVNGACETFTADAPTESVEWSPGAVPTGSYEILVFYVQDCESNGAVPFTINIVVDGEVQDPIRGTTLPNQVFIASFDVDEEGDVVVRDGGVNQGFLPDTAAEIIDVAETISRDETVEGVIVNEQPYQAFSFEAAAGDVITVASEATTGSLDTFLFLIDGSGSIVEQNDDANAQTRDAALNNVLLNQAGTYTIVLTRYGQQIGGTEGNYTLTLSGATSSGTNLPEALLGVDLPDGLIEVSLVWETNADIQLLVRDPVGDVVFDDSPIIPSGGTLDADGNVGCVQAEGTPYSYIYWPAGLQLRPGTYEIDVWFQNDCGDTTPVTPTLTVAIGGQVIISDTFTPVLRDHYIVTFTINLDGTVVAGEGGIPRGSENIDYLSELPNAAALTGGVPVQGTITDQNRFDVYTFDGTANETVTLRMDATAGTLDTLLFIIGPTGIELAANDDAVLNETTNSAITEFTLPQTGQYIVLATHYGTVYGGTNGSYTLSFSRLNTP